MPQAQSVPTTCSFADLPACDAPGLSCLECQAFGCRRCDSCPSAVAVLAASPPLADPLTSRVLNGWLGGELHRPG